MKAFDIDRRGHGLVHDVADPVASPGQAVIDVAFVGICGTDLGLFDADATRMLETHNHYPLRLGHEWSGTVTSVGDPADRSWIGRRVTGLTMLGCGHCAFCVEGLPNLCPDRFEIGVRGDWKGALAERLLVPVNALLALPDGVDDRVGAMTEPGGNSWRAVHASAAGPGKRILVLGSGTIGLLCAQFALAEGSEVHVLGIDAASLELAVALGVAGTWRKETLPRLRWDAVIDATDAPGMPSYALDVVTPGCRVVLIGVAHTPSEVDSRVLVRKELAVQGVLGATQGFEPAIAAFGSGVVDPLPLIGAVIGLDEVGAALAGHRPSKSGSGPKLLVDPSL
jgi:threonine dehydrogenase-like Zn-dependent dehydrogenase